MDNCAKFKGCEGGENLGVLKKNVAGRGKNKSMAGAHMNCLNKERGSCIGGE